MKSQRSRAASPKGEFSIVDSDDVSDQEWDRFVEMCPGGMHTQTSLWSQLKLPLNWQVRRFKVFSGGEIVGGAQMLMKKSLGISVGYVPHGPLIHNPSARLSAIVVRELKEMALRLGVTVLVVQPPLNSPLLEESFHTIGFAHTHVKQLATANVVVDLAADLDSLIMGMRKKTRNNIRRGPKEGLTVREGGLEDLSIFHELHGSTSRRCGFHLSPLENFQREWKLLNPLGYAVFFIVEHEGEPIASNWLITFGDTVLATRGGWSGKHARKRPNEMMDWYSICWAKENGYRYYDLEGIDIGTAKIAIQGKKIPPELSQTASYYKLGFGSVKLFPEPVVFIANPVMRWGHQNLFHTISKSNTFDRMFNYVRAS